jgi:hypothetical protein
MDIMRKHMHSARDCKAADKSHAWPMQTGDPNSGDTCTEQRAPCLDVAVAPTAEMGKSQASSQLAMGRREGGGACKGPPRRPVWVSTTRPPGSLSRGQSRAMSCCRWWSGCMHTKSCAWSSWRLCTPTPEMHINISYTTQLVLF